MSEMGYFENNGYKPIFSRQHLRLNDISSIKINLTKEEQETFDEIKKAINNRDIFNKQVIVRCAGGWVRDKLLNCQSDDIDLAVDQMTGEEFGNCLQKYFKTIKNQQLNIGKIQENPDKSKHLASVTFKLNNIEFDVVNLRTETYSQQSRVPIMKFGTAKQDSLRRDLTINALFYNINDNKIEDYTEKGIKDLINGIARTPLNAMETYKDDPLRILRNIRHAITKLGFILDDDIVTSAQNPQIHQLLRFKVSRERFAVEFEKMLKGYNVWIAIDILVKFGLAPILFQMPTNKNEIKYIPKDFDKNSAWQQSVILTKSITQLIIEKNKKNNDNDEEKKEETDNNYNLLLYLKDNDKKKAKLLQKEILFATFTYPFNGIKISKKKNKDESLIMYFVLHSMPGMEGGSDLGKMADIYHNGCQIFIQLLLRLENENDNVSNEQLSLEIGKFLRLCKDDWQNIMYLVKVVWKQYHYNQKQDGNPFERIEGLESFILTKSNLINCWKWKPILNGRELMDKYSKYGLGQDSRIGKLNQFMLEQRLSKPNKSTDDLMNELDPKIIEWLKKNPAPTKSKKKKSKKK